MPFPLPAGGELRIDYAGLGEMMKSPGIQAQLNQRAAVMAQILNSVAPGRIWVNNYATDRAVVAVTIGVQGSPTDVEAKNGYISDAALQAGLEVKLKPAGE